MTMLPSKYPWRKMWYNTPLVPKPKTMPSAPEPEKPLTKSDLEEAVSKANNKTQWLVVLVALGLWHPFGWGIAGSLAVVWCFVGFFRGWN
jgi:hypothetical protein